VTSAASVTSVPSDERQCDGVPRVASSVPRVHNPFEDQTHPVPAGFRSQSQPSNLRAGTAIACSVVLNLVKSFVCDLSAHGGTLIAGAT
jgi:hypothetical protein